MNATTRIALGISLACILLVVGWMSSPAAVTADPLPPRPTLTPRPSLTPQEIGGAQRGGYIELDVPTRQITLWTVVEWQDGFGNWHAVEGWQGTLDEINSAGIGRKVWWVSGGDMGKKPFRWHVYQSQNGQLLTTSRSFELPHYSGEIVRVQVTLQP
jgi:hypothetical protein